MKTIVLGFIFCLLMCGSSYAYVSGIAIQSDQSSNMSVYVNGKLYNKQPGKFVRIRSLPGLFHVQVKVFNPYDKMWYLLRKDIRVQKGYEFYYKVAFAKNQKPRLIEVRKYPVYSRYFLNPALYNQHPVS